ncbi:MAG: hypothetical protein GTO03_17650 [Planctomycetales bacterium]|nr:hypothetical protein [Planctomycetales bacterium]
MATQFLLPCPCGETHIIAKTQAGQQLECKCGAQLEVPTIRQMALLEPAPPSAGGGQPTGTWSPAQGALFVAGVFVLVAAAVTILLLIRSTPAVDPDDPQAWQTWRAAGHNLAQLQANHPQTLERLAAAWERDYPQLTPAQSLALWTLYRDRAPWMLKVTQDQRQLAARRARLRWWTYAVGSLAVVCGASLIAAALVLRR